MPVTVAWRLHINLTSYDKLGAIGTTDLGGRQLLFPIVSIAGLNVSRKAYVSQADNFVRRLNILENPTGAEITVTVRMDTDLGSDDSTSVIATSSGDTTVDALNPWSFSGRLNCMGELAEIGSG